MSEVFHLRISTLADESVASRQVQKWELIKLLRSHGYQVEEMPTVHSIREKVPKVQPEIDFQQVEHRIARRFTGRDAKLSIGGVAVEMYKGMPKGSAAMVHTADGHVFLEKLGEAAQKAGEAFHGFPTPGVAGPPPDLKPENVTQEMWDKADAETRDEIRRIIHERGHL